MNLYCILILVLSVIFAGLLFLDVLTTTLILDLGGSELNPTMKYIADHPYLHLLVKLLFAGFVVLMVCRVEQIKKHSGIVILIAVCTIFLVVVVHNFRVFLSGIFV